MSLNFGFKDKISQNYGSHRQKWVRILVLRSELWFPRSKLLSLLSIIIKIIIISQNFVLNDKNESKFWFKGQNWSQFWFSLTKMSQNFGLKVRTLVSRVKISLNFILHDKNESKFWFKGQNESQFWFS